MSKSVKQIFLLLPSTAALIYIVICAYMWSIQRQIIFEPTVELQTTPDRMGLKFKEVRIPSGSGAELGELNAWWLPADQENEPTLLYLHGNDKNIGHSHDVDNAFRMHGLGYNLLMVDYRGYGKSTGGKPNEAKVYEDAESAWNYLLKLPAITPGRTFIYGHSLGGAIAIDLAMRHPEAAGIIAESTFTSIGDMGRRNYSYLPVGLLLNQHFDSLDKVSKLKIPVMFIHGTWDRIVPWQMSQQLFDQAPQPKFLKLINGGQHSNNSTVGWLEYRDTLTTFVQKYAH
jgi:fermentation-respiration switch protein FrsA (DUF1100 family)